MTAAYPLSWPFGRARTAARRRRRATFNSRQHNGRYPETRPLTVGDATDRLQSELDLLHVYGAILSTNVALRLDGRPRSGQSEPADPGAALYFRLANRDIALACDRWDRVADNICAIAKHLEAMRGMARWGVGSIEEAFAGYQALPSRAAPDVAGQAWWIVLGVDRTASLSDIDAAWREKIRKAHPDNGGSPDLAAAINRARDEARKERTYHA